MAFAFVYVHRQGILNSYQIIKTTFIKNFDAETYYCADPTKRTEKIYTLIKSDDSRASCQVLAVADTAVEIEQIRNSRRWHVPKLSVSAINQFTGNSSSSEERSSESEVEKRRRKKDNKEKTMASKKKQDEICSKYQRLNKIYDDSESEDLCRPITNAAVSTTKKDNKEKTMASKKKQEEICSKYQRLNKIYDDSESEDLCRPITNAAVSTTKNKKLRMTTEENATPIDDSLSYRENGRDRPFFSTPLIEANHAAKSSSLLSDGISDIEKENIRPLKRNLYPPDIKISKKPKLSDGDLNSEIINVQHEAEYWKEKYYNLLNSKAYSLTEKTGETLVNILKQLDVPGNNNSIIMSSSKETNGKQDNDISGDDKLHRQINDPSTREADKSMLNSLMKKKFKDAAECAKTIIRSTWTDEELENRVVRKTAGIKKQVLTPEKVERVKSVFRGWLGKKGYVKDAQTMELDQLNNYLCRVVENVNRKKKRHVASTKTLPENKDDEANKQSS